MEKSGEYLIRAKGFSGVRFNEVCPRDLDIRRKSESPRRFRVINLRSAVIPGDVPAIILRSTVIRGDAAVIILRSSVIPDDAAVTILGSTVIPDDVPVINPDSRNFTDDGGTG